MWVLFLVLSVLGGELYFGQKLDHFNQSSNITFQQRYYVNDTYFSSGGPGFIYIGGESALKEKRVMKGLMVDLAQEHHGVVYGLEHRYYGMSLPFPNLSVANLKYLSSDQALEDLAHFAKSVKPHRPSKWFLIGGSYPGMLAAWARQKYPQVFHAALASSAPVHAKADFYEYDEMVGFALGKKCQSSVNKVMVYLDELYAQGKLEPIKRALNCTKVYNDKLFLFTIADVVAGIVQYNKIVPPSIDDLCSSINAETREVSLEKFETILNTYFRIHHKSCFEYSYVQQLQSRKPSEDDNIKQWTYQTCQEFGYWQTASKLPTRSKYLTADWIESFYCSPPFFTPAIGPPKTDLINTKHHGKNINPSNILFTHGEKDPWFKLSYTKQNSIVIPNGSHCNDLNPAIYHLANFSKIRDKIRATFRTWIIPKLNPHNIL